ncbi:MAG: DUF433 domain-containing protein [Gemmataceae bacterium]|nr:DUF433 domain-containing protein [Gemmataceae bacterium]
MQLEDYFEFEKFETEYGEVERIRVKGTRIAIEIIIQDYLGGSLPEQIVANYRRSLSLEQVFATLTYYLHNKAAVDSYIEHGDAIGEAYYQEHLRKEPPEVVKRLRALRAESPGTAAGS